MIGLWCMAELDDWMVASGDCYGAVRTNKLGMM